MENQKAHNRLKTLYKYAFDKEFGQRKSKLFNRVFKNKKPKVHDIAFLDAEAQDLIREHFPKMAADFDLAIKEKGNK